MAALRLPRAWSEALEQLQRDVRSVRRRIAGQHAPPLVRDRKLRAVRPAPTGSAARELVIDRVVREARDVVTLVLRDPGGAPFDFEAGQFFTVLTSIGGETVPRNYSATSTPGAPELHLTIKRKEGGRVSGLLCASRAGDALRVIGPFGSFVLGPDVRDAGADAGRAARSLVLFAGGVGITPLYTIARRALEADPRTTVALVYGNRTREDVAFAGALDALVTAYPGRLVVRHVLEFAGDDGPALRAVPGRLDRATCAALLAELGARGATYYVCGPEGMTGEVLAAIATHDPHAAVRTERFTTGARRSGQGTRPLTIRVGGREHRAAALAGATLLDAGLAAGAPMPSSCAMGGCGACRVKLVSGEVEMDEPNCLGDAERRDGYVLACVGRPSGPCVIEIEGHRSDSTEST